MRLHAYLAQAVLPGADRLQFVQLPGITMDELTFLAPGAKDLDDFVQALEEKQDARLMDVRKAMEKWGRIEIVDAAFKGVSCLLPSRI
jgi:translocation protein SEC63